MNPLKVSRSVAEKEMSEVGSPLSVATILPSPSNLHLIYNTSCFVTDGDCDKSQFIVSYFYLVFIGGDL